MNIVEDASNIKQNQSESIYSEQHEKIIKYVCSNTNLTREQAINGLHNFNGDYKKVINIATVNHLVDIVMRQTTYNREEAIEELKKFNGEPVDVIRNFMGIKKKKESKPNTTNQMIYHEIRNFMDDVNKGYTERKKRSERINEIRQKIMNDNSNNS